MNILKARPLFYLLSLSLLVLSVFSIVVWGFKPSVDFAGGAIWQISFSPGVDTSQIQPLFDQQDISFNSITSSQDHYILKTGSLNQQQKQSLTDSLIDLDPEFKLLQFETLSPLLGRELLQKTIYAIIASSLVLFIFINSRFKDRVFGLSALLAMFHDTFILIGSAALLGHFFGFEVDTLFVTAVLTTLSASVHDTVVTFDRIRELRLNNYKQDISSLANQAVSETLVRSINNSMTIIFMLFSLVMLGGATTRNFAIALLIGAVLGTYSSLGVAVPLLLLFKHANQANPHPPTHA